jgi:predicted nucleic acid-binding protein
LDTSALVKRYVEEPGSDVVDTIFEEAHDGGCTVAFSHWNIGKAAMVFNKYGERSEADAKGTMGLFLSETKTLSLTGRLRLIPVGYETILGCLPLVFRYHVYVADALQLASCSESGAQTFLTGDRRLHEAAETEGLESQYVG